MSGLTEKQRAVLAELYQRTQCAATELADASGFTLRATHQHLDALETKGMLTSRARRSVVELRRLGLLVELAPATQHTPVRYQVVIPQGCQTEISQVETPQIETSHVVSPLRHPLRVVRIAPSGIVALGRP